MHKKNSIQVNTVFRAKLIGLVFLLLAILLVVQIIHIQFIDTAKYKNNFEGRIIRVKEIEAPRGTIYAQDGRTLAVDIPHYDLHFDATAVGIFDLVQQKKIQDSLQAMSEYLHRIFPDKPTNGYLSLFQAAIAEKSKFKLLQKNISYAQYEQLKEMPLAARGKNKGGLIFVQKTKRYLPQGELAKRTIGYTNDKGNSVGLEHSFSKILSGEKGLQKQKRVGASIWLPLSDDYVHRPQKGADITTTLDLDIQDLAYTALSEQLHNHSAQSGLAIVMEVKTGYIRAMVNLTKKANGSYVEDFNYAVGGYYEPGSTFKIPILMVALEDGKAHITDSVHTSPGVRQFYDLQMRESKKEGYGHIPLAEALAYSTNIGIADIIWKHYSKEPHRLIEGLERMGLHQKTNIEIAGEKTPYIKSPKDKLWSGITLPQMSIGYEVLLSPIQILNFYNTIANGGKMMQPKLVQSISYQKSVFSGIQVQNFFPEVIREQIASKKTIAQVQKVLQNVVEIGSAKVIKNPYFSIAGKTGTAQVLQTDKKTYKDKSGKANYYSSFVGYFPVEDPKYSIFVAVSEPTKGYYSSEVAAPIFRQIAYPLYAKEYHLDFKPNPDTHPTAPDFPYSVRGKLQEILTIYQHLGFKLQLEEHRGEWVKVEVNKDQIRLKNIDDLLEEGKVPTVLNMGLRDALYLLQKVGLKVQVLGKMGRVKQQSLVAGTTVQKNMDIVLQLSID